MMKIITKKSYVILVSTLVVGAIGVAVTVSLLLLGLGSSRTGLALMQSAQAKALANACAEEAMQKIALSLSYTGTGSLVIGGNTCNYTVVKDGAATTVSAVGTVGTVIRKINITFDANGLTWREIP